MLRKDSSVYRLISRVADEFLGAERSYIREFNVMVLEYPGISRH
ncbi:predicted protein [Botrytis cinerea T4]|uniref:Uncharacterized protein n=1 Tax=Botryotinia fuckeliana (strain T4) TaxID=999810 RepID=G2XPT5_BOTF4|nr:predicted protein [Botrytis cinerea T4]